MTGDQQATVERLIEHLKTRAAGHGERIAELIGSRLRGGESETIRNTLIIGEAVAAGRAGREALAVEALREGHGG